MTRGFLILILVTASIMLCAQTRIDTLATLNSYNVLGEFATLDYQGDYEEMLQYLNTIYTSGSEPYPQDFNCSLYSAIGDANNLFYGRNMDNPAQDVMVARYTPPNGYRNIALNRLSDLGIPSGTDLTSLTSAQKRLLLKAPYFTADGLNEAGLAAGLAYVPTVTYVPDPDKQTIYITMLTRRILDEAATCQQALDIANSYNVIDMAYNAVSHHLLITDATGESVILEFVVDRFVAIPTDVDWQVLTNTAIYGHNLEYLYSHCDRYPLLYEALEDQAGILTGWRNAMDILSLTTWQAGSQGTQWSTIAQLNDAQLYISIDRDFDNIARVDVDNFEFLNFGDLYLNPILVDNDYNGLYEQGETIMLYLAVSADFPTPDLSVTIADPEGLLVMTTTEYIFGDLIPGIEMMNSESPFYFTIPTYFPLGDATIDASFTTSYGRTFEYSFDFEVVEPISTDDVTTVPQFELDNSPNPFNPETVIHYAIPEQAMTSLKIYNTRGQLVRTLVSDIQSEGKHEMVWDGRDQQSKPLASGVYFYRLESGKHTLTRKLMMLK